MDNKLVELLYRKQQILEAILASSSSLEHPVSNGDNSEKAWEKFLIDILSKKYQIAKGKAIDSNGKTSEQIDLIIYDALYSPLIFISEGGEKYIPAESIYATIEVKPTLTKEYLEYANKKIKSVKDLFRTSRGMTVAGKRVPLRDVTNILGIILTKTSSIAKKETLYQHFKEYDNINFGCALDSFTFYCDRDNETADSLNVNYTGKEETLIGLFFHLYNDLHKIGTVAAIDIRKYANSLESFNFNTEGEF